MTITNPIAIDLGIFIKNIYTNPETNKTLLETLVTGEIHRNICTTIYKLITKDGSVDPIEKIDVEAKKKWWEEAKKLANGRMDNEKCIELSKALYTLDLLSQQ
jgi:hypothetical protein